jgi:hypothetical protein
VAEAWPKLFFFRFLNHGFKLVWEPAGRLLGGRLGAANAPQDNSFYPTKYQPDWLHLASTREGCLVSASLTHFNWTQLPVHPRLFCDVIYSGSGKSWVSRKSGQLLWVGPEIIKCFEAGVSIGLQGVWASVSRGLYKMPREACAYTPRRLIIMPGSEHFLISRPPHKSYPNFLLTRVLGLPVFI